MTEDSNNHSDHRPRSILEWTLWAIFTSLSLLANAAQRFVERTEWGFGAVFHFWSIVAGWFTYFLEKCGHFSQILLVPFVVLGDVVLQLFARLANRTEWTFGESLGAFGTIFRYLIAIIRVPLRLVESIFVRIWLSRPFVFVRTQLRRIMPSWIPAGFSRFRVLVEILAIPFFVGRDFVRAWFSTRDFRGLAIGSGAMLLAAPTVVALLLAVGDRREDVSLRYRKSLAAAVEQNDEARIELCLAKLESLDSQRQERDLYHVALAAAETNGVASALARMRTLAYSEDGGYHPAMIWMADHLLRQDAVDENDIRKAEKLVRGVISQRGESPWTAIMLAEVSVARGDLQQAITGLRHVSDELNSFEVFARLVELHDMSNDAEQANAAAARAVSCVRSEAYRSFSFTQHIQYANALARKRDWVMLQSQLDFLSREHSDNDYDETVVRLISLGVALDVPGLSRSLYRLSNNNATLVRWLARQLVLDTDGIVPFLQQQESSGRVESVLYRIAGDECRSAGDVERAVRFYDKATAVDPNDAVAWNNTAWLHLQANRIQQAIDAANVAVALDPSPPILETRGQILVKLKRWEEAIRDLEVALNGELQNPAPAHATLAGAFAAVGEPELAKAHLREATKLRLAHAQNENAWSD